MVIFDDKSLYNKTDKSNYFLGYYVPNNISYHSTDYYIVIPTKYDLKPGNMANDLYGDPQLLWVFSVYNRDVIQDPLFDFRAGIIIRIPTKQRLLSLI